MDRLAQVTGFQWDAGNQDKSWERHRVSRSECEQVFFNRPFLLSDDQPHSEDEPRFYALGQTDLRRLLFVVFTLRETLLRVISARDMTRRERREYFHGKEEDSDFQK